MITTKFLWNDIQLYDIRISMCVPKFPFMSDIFIILLFVNPVTVLYNTLNLVKNNTSTHLIQYIINNILSILTHFLSAYIGSPRPFVQCVDPVYFGRYALPATEQVYLMNTLLIQCIRIYVDKDRLKDKKQFFFRTDVMTRIVVLCMIPIFYYLNGTSYYYQGLLSLLYSIITTYLFSYIVPVHILGF
jgi:hypothetical protein